LLSDDAAAAASAFLLNLSLSLSFSRFLMFAGLLLVTIFHFEKVYDAAGFFFCFNCFHSTPNAFSGLLLLLLLLLCLMLRAS